jgi:hypothetical protein
MDLSHFRTPDTDPHQSKKPDPDTHQGLKQDPHPHRKQNSGLRKLKMEPWWRAVTLRMEEGGLKLSISITLKRAAECKSGSASE